MDAIEMTSLAMFRVHVSRVMRTMTMRILICQIVLKNKYKFQSAFDTASAINELIASYANM